MAHFSINIEGIIADSDPGTTPTVPVNPTPDPGTGGDLKPGYRNTLWND